MNANRIFQHFQLRQQLLPGSIVGATFVQFREQMHTMFNQPIALQTHHVVYLFATNSEIPRVRGSSDILYIGKTDQTIQSRHGVAPALDWYEPHWPRYQHVIQTYGRITFHFAEVQDPRDTELQFLQLYYDDHFELPPTNSQR